MVKNEKDFATFQERDKALEELMQLDGWLIGKKIER